MVKLLTITAFSNAKVLVKAVAVLAIDCWVSTVEAPVTIKSQISDEELTRLHRNPLKEPEVLFRLLIVIPEKTLL